MQAVVRLGHITAITLQQAFTMVYDFGLHFELNSYSNLVTHAVVNAGHLPILKVRRAPLLCISLLVHELQSKVVGIMSSRHARGHCRDSCMPAYLGAGGRCTGPSGLGPGAPQQEAQGTQRKAHPGGLAASPLHLQH